MKEKYKDIPTERESKSQYKEMNVTCAYAFWNVVCNLGLQEE